MKRDRDDEDFDKRESDEIELEHALLLSTVLLGAIVATAYILI